MGAEQRLTLIRRLVNRVGRAQVLNLRVLIVGEWCDHNGGDGLPLVGVHDEDRDRRLGGRRVAVPRTIHRVQLEDKEMESVLLPGIEMVIADQPGVDRRELG